MGFFVSNDRSMTETEYAALFVGNDPVAGNFDLTNNSGALKAIAVVQSQSADISGDTEEVLDLTKSDADWANPVVSKRSATFSATIMMTKEVASGSGQVTIDDTKYLRGEELKVGDEVCVIQGDYPLAVGGTIDMICRAVVTGKTTNPTAGSNSTMDVTLQAKGEVREAVTIA